jgi:hypothetical protein
VSSLNDGKLAAKFVFNRIVINIGLG